MAKSKLYIRTLSTILSVLTIFSGIYNSYGVKAGGPENETSNQAVKPKDGAKDEKKGKRTGTEGKKSDNDSALNTPCSSLVAVTDQNGSNSRAVCLSSDSFLAQRGAFGELEGILKKSDAVCQENTLKWVEKWGKCLEHFSNILLCCKKHTDSEELEDNDIEKLVKAFNFIIENNTISPSEKDVLVSAELFSKGLEAVVKDELAIPYNMLRNICMTAKTRKRLGFITSEIKDDKEFKDNVYDVFKKNKGSVGGNVNSIWPLVTVLNVKVAERLTLFKEYGDESLNNAATSIAKLSSPLVNSLFQRAQLFSRGLFVDFYYMGNKFVCDASQTLANTLVDATEDIRRNFASGGGARDIAKPIANEFEGALKNAATTSLDYAKTTALQTGAGLAGIFVASKLVCNLISKIGSDSNNRNKQQKQAVAENCEKSA